MHLVFLYGPPAVGKLTVGTEVARRMGYRLFHNHLSVDVVEALFDFGTAPFYENVAALRLQLLEQAAELGVAGVVFTFVYVRPDDDGFVAKVAEIVESRGGDVDFVRLACDQATLEARVADPSRRRWRKLSTVEGLRKKLASGDLMSPMTGRVSLELDGSAPPAENAEAILRRRA